MEWVVSFSSIMITTALGVLAYTNTKKKQEVDEGSILVSDALKIKEAYQEMYDEVEVRAERLMKELDSAIRQSEMWRGVAHDGFVDYKKTHGTVPKWWPSTEPLPDAT